MPQFTTDAFFKYRLLSVQAKIIKVDVTSLGRGQWPDSVNTPEGRAGLGRRVEEIDSILHRLRGESTHVPCVLFPYESDSIPCQTNIRSFSWVHKPARSEIEFLPSEPND